MSPIFQVDNVCFLRHQRILLCDRHVFKQSVIERFVLRRQKPGTVFRQNWRHQWHCLLFCTVISRHVISPHIDVQWLQCFCICSLKIMIDWLINWLRSLRQHNWLHRQRGYETTDRESASTLCPREANRAEVFEVDRWTTRGCYSCIACIKGVRGGFIKRRTREMRLSGYNGAAAWLQQLRDEHHSSFCHWQLPLVRRITGIRSARPEMR